TGRWSIRSRDVNPPTSRFSLAPGSRLPTEALRSGGQPLLEVALALPQRPLSIFQRSFVGAILDLDAYRPAITHVSQDREEGPPVDVAQPRQLRRVPAQSVDADRVQPVLIDPRVLGVDVDDLLAEVADAADVIDVLPDQV